MVRILVAQPGSAVSEVNCPQNGKASTFPRVKVVGAGLRFDVSGISVVRVRFPGAGLCSLFSNFRFRGEETGSTVARDRFEVRMLGKSGVTPTRGQPPWPARCLIPTLGERNSSLSFCHSRAAGTLLPGHPQLSCC